nr:uncharacterized protein LOC124810748 [Hydra vulgaris]
MASEEKKNYSKRKKLEQEFSSVNVSLMQEKRSLMNAQKLFVALSSFNNIASGCEGYSGGVYEILENNVIIYISGLPYDVHIRDALNAHFSGNDRLAIGNYLSRIDFRQWKTIQVRFLQSKNPREDAKLLIRHFQLTNQGKMPIFN